MSSPNGKIKIQLKLVINDIELERVYENKFLGVITDYKLTWKLHISSVKNKISKTMAILDTHKHTLYILYCALFLPYILYCVEVWGNTDINNIKPIFMLQKKAIRIINHAVYKDSTNPLLNCKY